MIIMDGWAHGRVEASDAIRHARTPFVSSLYARYPNTTLTTSGEAVGLPEGQMGNSEVGHLNLGAGRIVYQELQRINVAIRDGSFAKNDALLQAVAYARDHQKPLHLIGLVSDGGVHSHINHLEAILDVCHQHDLRDVRVHAFMDGRDCDPRSGAGFLRRLQQHMDATVGKIATVCGRYYAMDRDNRWERVQLAYDAMVNGHGEKAADAVRAVEASYEKNITDEFIRPIVITGKDQPASVIKDGDVVVCFNFRTDRCREITKALTQTEFPLYKMKPLQLHYTTMTEYDATFNEVHVMFTNDNLNHTIGDVIAGHGLRQIRIAETEKYPHVTFFFSGGRERPFEGEQRIMIASPKVATYDMQPEMSAPEVTSAIVEALKKDEASFICLNYANADMVGHTGVWEAAIRAVETVDQCVSSVVTTALEHGYTVFLTADHGNADYMINEDGTPNTAHTTNPVPLFIIDNTWNGTVQPGKLADIAPTILHMMGLPIPEEMTGTILTS
ncbi:MAG TPA: 2,3-bisphosphoglycerate-independent phosphoglycerate mutase [Flavisolibacter sp.]